MKRCRWPGVGRSEGLLKQSPAYRQPAWGSSPEGTAPCCLAFKPPHCFPLGRGAFATGPYFSRRGQGSGSPDV